MSTHSASGPALGYQYQADYCLYTLIKDGGPGQAISLELHDDVAWDDSGSALEKLQVKHSVRSRGGLADTSVKLWTTLKAWIDAGNPGDTQGPALCLVTTDVAAEGSAAYTLRPATRSAASAAAALRTAATTSKATETEAARAAFRALSIPAQNALVARIRVLDGAPNVRDIDAAVRKELWRHLPAGQKKQDDFMDLLWGWWRRRSIDMLSHRYFPEAYARPVVTARELTAELTRLTVAFSEHGLPEFEDLDFAEDDEALGGLDSEVFVQQLGLLNYSINTRTVRKAIVEYHRAVTSEVRWLERDFLHTEDVRRYERKMREAWDVAFGFMVDNLAEDASAEERVSAGRQLLQSVLTREPLRIRTHVDQDFYYRGKNHMLAQDKAVGWHPDFRELLDNLLLAGRAVR